MFRQENYNSQISNNQLNSAQVSQMVVVLFNWIFSPNVQFFTATGSNRIEIALSPLQNNSIVEKSDNTEKRVSFST